MPPLTSSERFVAQPFVCGAFGDDSKGLFARLIAVAPTRVVVRHDTAQVRFAASASSGLERARGGWTWGRYVARDTRATDPRHASDDIGLAGFWTDTQSATLHTDWLGTQDVYVRSLGDTIYWANRLSPLVEFTRGPLHANTDAWRTCLMLSGFMGGSTPFSEITRLAAGERLCYERGETKLTTEYADWFTDPAGTATVDDLAASIEAAVPHSRLRPTHLMLSGGLDSRLLLAASLHRPGRRPRAWSTHHESGWDGDTRVAGQIVDAMHLEHHVVDYGPDDWLAAREATFDRLEHATSMHNWFLPLATVLQTGSMRTPLLDGLGGDVLMRYHDEIPAADRASKMNRVWGTLGARGFLEASVVRQEIREKWEHDARSGWRQQTVRWDDHPFAESVVRLLSRTRRAVAAAPFRLLSPERHVLTPLIDPEVVRVALSVPPLAASDRDLRPRVLGRLNPTLAAIPSTVSRDVNRGMHTERGPSSSAAAQSMVTRIQAEPAVAELFVPGALDALTTRGDGGSIPPPVRRAAMLAHWLYRWRSGLAESPSFD